MLTVGTPGLCHQVRVSVPLIRYWFEFDPSNSSSVKATPWWGVTAWTVEDARSLISEAARFGQSLPQPAIKKTGIAARAAAVRDAFA